MILNHQEIIEANKNGEISIVPFEESQVEPATYDLRVGAQGATTSTKKIININEAGYLLLQPGDFATVTVLEELRLSTSYAGRFGLRSKYARKGLIATTGSQIDPGYHGRLILGLTNLTPKPISLPYKDDFVSVEFHKLEKPTDKPYNGPYQDRLALGPEEIEAVTETEGMALSEVISTLRSLSINVAKLASEVNTLRWTIPTIVGLGIAIIAALIAFKH